MNKWTYLLVFDDAVGTRREVLDFLDRQPEILNWYTCLSNAVFIVSTKTASELTSLFRSFTSDKGRFVILDTDTDRTAGCREKPGISSVDGRPRKTKGAVASSEGIYCRPEIGEPQFRRFGRINSDHLQSAYVFSFLVHGHAANQAHTVPVVNPYRFSVGWERADAVAGADEAGYAAPVP